MYTLEAGHIIDRYTLGEIRQAGVVIGVPDLAVRVIEGQQLFCYAACRFLTRNTEDCAKCPERTECHRTLAREVVLHGS